MYAIESIDMNSKKARIRNPREYFEWSKDKGEGAPKAPFLHEASFDEIKSNFEFAIISKYHDAYSLQSMNIEAS